MDLTEENRQRAEFRDILFDLSKNQELLKNAAARSNMYRRLEALYYSPAQDKRFRHFYSDVFSVLTQLQHDSNLGDINILGQNLALIREGYVPKNKADNGNLIDVSDAIRKLYDHVNLDIARIGYSDGADRKISGEETIQRLQAQVNSIPKKIDQAELTLSNVTESVEAFEAKLDNAQKEYIAILGIFASVVLAFTAGIAFSTSVLNNIAQASVYRTIIVALIIGLVLTNILFALFYYVNKLVNKDKKNFPIFISNLIFLLLIGATIVAWKFGIVEHRNIFINNLCSTSTFVETTGDDNSTESTVAKETTP